MAAEPPLKLKPEAVTRIPVPTSRLVNAPAPAPASVTTSPAKILPLKVPPVKVAVKVLSNTLFATVAPVTVNWAGITLIVAVAALVEPIV